MIFEFPVKSYKLQDNQRLIVSLYDQRETYKCSLHVEWFDGEYWQWKCGWLLTETFEELKIWCDLHNINIENAQIR